MNIALLQLHCRAGHPEHNCGLIRRAVEGAVIASQEITSQAVVENSTRVEDSKRDEGSLKHAPLLCVTPELAVCGSPLDGLPHTAGFVDRCMNALAKLAKELRAAPPLMVGTLDRNPETNEFESTVYLLERGNMRRLCARPLAAATGYGSVRGLAQPVCVPCHGRCVALWLGTPPENPDIFANISNYFSYYNKIHSSNPTHADLQKADIHINMDAAPFEPTFWQQRHARLSRLALATSRPVLRVNPVGGNGGWIFPGGAMSLDAGGCLRTEAAPFKQELLLEILRELEMPTNSPTALPGQTAPEETPTTPRNTPREAAMWDALVLGLRDFVRGNGFRGVVLGLSGGMDSALVAALAVAALGPDNVTGVLMPSPWSSEGSVTDSLELAANLGIATHTLPIGPLMDTFEATLAPVFADQTPDVTEENLQARIRGTLLMAMSNKFGLMLLSTSNKSESAAGYGTLYGDLAGSLSPLADVYKTETYALAHWCNQLSDKCCTFGGKSVIPQAIFTKAPSAELRPGQKDQDSLPPYEALDAFVQAELEGRPTDVLPPKEAERFRGLLRRSEFKRHQSAQPLFVSSRPLALYKRPLPA